MFHPLTNVIPMKTIRIFPKWMMATVIVFGVETSAYAQLGGLLNNAKKAAKGVLQSQTTGTEAGAQAVSVLSAGGPEKGGYAWELNQVEKAGGWAKYLGFDSTPEGQLAMRYFSMSKEEYSNSDDLALKTIYNTVYYNLAMPIRVMKGLKEGAAIGWDQSAIALNKLNKEFDEAIQNAQKSRSAHDVPISKADADLLIKLRDQVKKAYLDFTGFHEKTAEEKQAEADASYVREFKHYNYYLDELKDKDYSHPKIIEKLKPLFIEKVQQELAPDKILGTYSANLGWHSILAEPRYTNLKEQYRSAEERQFRTYYEKGGKYYVIKGGFRQVIDKEDQLERSYEDKNNWPGLETPVEIPARLSEGKF